MDSILLDVKLALGIEAHYDAFNSDIIMHVNSALSTLTQLGVGSDEGYSILSADDKWSDFVTEPPALINFVKQYVRLKVKVLFDPPASSTVIQSIENQIKELEWRINVLVDPKKEETV